MGELILTASVFIVPLTQEHLGKKDQFSFLNLESGRRKILKNYAPCLPGLE